MKAARLTFLVTIEQINPEEKREFGVKEEWAKFIKKKLNETLTRVKVVEVKPTRTRTFKTIH